MVLKILSKLSFFKQITTAKNKRKEIKNLNLETSLDKQLELAKKKIEQSARPFFLYDDDPDGLSSFLLLYKMVRSGKAMAIKGSLFSERMIEIIKNYQPDLIIILDKPVIEKEFFENITTPSIWIDHHDPSDEVKSIISKKKIIYVNPRLYNKEDNQPTSLLAYKITKKDLWLAVTGIIADWQLPPKELRKQCEQECSGFLDEKFTSPEDALYKSQAGKLARVFSFNLKGKSSELLTSMKILSRINDPQELLQKKHSQAKLIMKKYEQKLSEYELLKSKVKIEKNDPVLLFVYDGNQNSYTTDLSNELLYLHSDKVIIIARQSGDSYKCSLRSKYLRVDKILEKTLLKVEGKGGGHEHACGAVIPNNSFDNFIDEFRKNLNHKI